jgi:hypothetical protein
MEMKTLPPIYRPLIIIKNGQIISGGATMTTTTTTTTTTTDFNTQQFDSQYQIPTTEATATDYTTGADFSTLGQTTFSTTTDFGTGMAMGGEPVVKVLRRGQGITLNEQNGIIEAAKQIYVSKITPISNNTARAVKKKLGGDWIVIVYEQGKPIDFNMTCVQGNDYLYFTLDTIAFQVCRLR